MYLLFRGIKENHEQMKKLDKEAFQIMVAEINNRTK